jgi:hypothetical protein
MKLVWFAHCIETPVVVVVVVVVVVCSRVNVVPRKIVQ